MNVLYLMRHGEASFDAVEDFGRPLTPFGHNQVGQVAKKLKERLEERSLHLGFVWVSPFLRAQQTWSILCEELSTSYLLDKTNVRLDAPITPMDKPSAVLSELEKYQENLGLEQGVATVLVAHQPLLGRLSNCLEQGEDVDQGLDTSCVLEMELEYLGFNGGRLTKSITPG